MSNSNLTVTTPSDSVIACIQSLITACTVYVTDLEQFTTAVNTLFKQHKLPVRVCNNDGKLSLKQVICKRTIEWHGQVEDIEVDHHVFAWSGRFMPCTGLRRCIYCGEYE